jgi:hypothetical protein
LGHPFTGSLLSSFQLPATHAWVHAINCPTFIIG